MSMTASPVISVSIARPYQAGVTLQREVVSVTREQALPGGYTRADVTLMPGTVPASVWLPDSDVTVTVDGYEWFVGRSGDPGEVAGYLTNIPILGPVAGYGADHRYRPPYTSDGFTLRTTLECLVIIASDIAPDLTVGTGQRADDPQGQHALIEFEGMTLIGVLNMIVAEGSATGEQIDYLAFDRTVWLRRRRAPTIHAAHYIVPRDHPGLARRSTRSQTYTGLRVKYTVGGAVRYTTDASISGATDASRRPRTTEIDGGELTDAAAEQLRDARLARLAVPSTPTTVRAIDGLHNPGGLLIPPWRVRTDEYAYVKGDLTPLAIVSVRDSMPPSGVEVTLDAERDGLPAFLSRLVSKPGPPGGVQYARGMHPDATHDVNTQALKSMLAERASQGGGEVLIPPGTFYLTAYNAGNADLITVPAGVTLRGSGADKTVLIADAATIDALGTGVGAIRLILVDSDAAVCDLTVDGNRDNVTLTHNISEILITTNDNAERVRYENVIARNIFASGTEEGWGLGLKWVDGGDIINCEAYNSDGTGISVSGDYTVEADQSRNVRVTNCRTHDCQWVGLTIYGSRYVVVTGHQSYSNGNTTTDRGTGINVEYSHHVTITGAHCYDNFKRNISLIGDSHHVSINGQAHGAKNTSGTTGAEINLGPVAWSNTSTIIQPSDVLIQNCLLTPLDATHPHINCGTSALVTSGPSMPSRVVIVGGNDPASWDYAQSSLLGQVAFSGSIDPLRCIREDILPALTGWTRQTATLASVSGGYTTLESTATQGRYVTLMTAQTGLWYLRGVVQAVTTGVVWRIGFRKASDGNYYNQWTFQPVTADVGVDIPFVLLSDFDQTSTDYYVAVQCATTGATNQIKVKWLALGLVDGFGAVV